MTLPANPWMALGIGVLALLAYALVMLPFYVLLYAHGEREAQHIPVEVDR